MGMQFFSNLFEQKFLNEHPQKATLKDNCSITSVDSVLVTKYFDDFLLDSDQIISPCNINTSFLPRGSLKAPAWNVAPSQHHSQVLLLHDPTCGSHWAPLPLLNISTLIQITVVFALFPLPELPFSSPQSLSESLKTHEGGCSWPPMMHSESFLASPSHDNCLLVLIHCITHVQVCLPQ